MSKFDGEEVLLVSREPMRLGIFEKTVVDLLGPKVRCLKAFNPEEGFSLADSHRDAILMILDVNTQEGVRTKGGLWLGGQIRKSKDENLRRMPLVFVSTNRDNLPKVWNFSHYFVWNDNPDNFPNLLRKEIKSALKI